MYRDSRVQGAGDEDVGVVQLLEALPAAALAALLGLPAAHADQIAPLLQQLGQPHCAEALRLGHTQQLQLAHRRQHLCIPLCICSVDTIVLWARLLKWQCKCA